jgi:hypothetical protein
MSKRIPVADDSEIEAGTVLNYTMPNEEVRPREPAPSDKNEGTQPKGTLEEDPDKVRGEVFKRMFPDLPKKFPE